MKSTKKPYLLKSDIWLKLMLFISEELGTKSNLSRFLWTDDQKRNQMIFQGF